MKEIKELCLFSGYGGSLYALSLAGIPHKCIGYSDIKDCANYIFALNHGEDIPQLGDITKINPDDLEDFDLLTAGWPCQSFSLSGLRKGFEDETKGQLFFEVIRILKAKKPRYFLGENVQGLLSHDNGRTMEITLNEIKKVGYYVRWKLLYSKEHGTPQNRPRVWFACFREKEDADKFLFPEKEELKITVKDLLEDEVDEKYYFNETQLQRLMTPRFNSEFKNPIKQNLNEPFRTLTSHMSRDVCDVPFFQTEEENTLMYNTAHTKAQGSRFKDDGVSFTLEATKGQSLCIADFRYDEGLRVNNDNVCPTLTSNQSSGEKMSSCPIIFDDRASVGFQAKSNNGISPTLKAVNGDYALKEQQKSWRRLTPRECFRIQGFFQDQIKFGNLSDSKLYFLAGNGWDLSVASKIFKQMFIGNQNQQRGLEDF